MKAELFISLISLIASILIGVRQIKLAKDNKAIKLDIKKLEAKIISQSGKGNIMKGIIGNSNNGDISNNIL